VIKPSDDDDAGCINLAPASDGDSSSVSEDGRKRREQPYDLQETLVEANKKPEDKRSKHHHHHKKHHHKHKAEKETENAEKHRAEVAATLIQILKSDDKSAAAPESEVAKEDEQEHKEAEKKRVHGMRRCVLIPQLAGGAQLADDICEAQKEDIGIALRKHFSVVAGVTSGRLETWSMWGMPLIVPLALAGPSMSIMSPILANVAWEFQARLKGACSHGCPNAQIGTLSVNQGPAAKRQRLEYGHHRLQWDKTTKSNGKKKDPSAQVKDKLTIPVCRVPALLLACFYRTCGDNPLSVCELIDQADEWLSISARVYTPKHRRTPRPASGAAASREIMYIDPLEEDYMKLELCYKLILSGKITKLVTYQGLEMPATPLALLNIARRYSPVDCFQVSSLSFVCVNCRRT
jgi:hypothetical protein